MKLAELDETIAQCAGLFVEAQARQFEVAPGATLNVTATVLNRSTAKVELEGARVEGIWNQDGQVKPASLGYNQSAEVAFSLVVPANQAYTQPYWLVKPATADVYQVDDQMLIGLPDTPAAAQVRVRLTVDGAADRTGAAGASSLCRPRAGRACAPVHGGARGGGESAGAGGAVPGCRRRVKCRFRCRPMWPTRKGDLRLEVPGRLEGRTGLAEFSRSPPPASSA